MTLYNELTTIGTRIRDCRKKLGMSQEELSEKMFTSKQMISNYETDKTELKLSVLKELAQALGTTTTYLIDGKQESIYKDAVTMELISLFNKINDLAVRKVAIEQLRLLMTLQR